MRWCQGWLIFWWEFTAITNWILHWEIDFSVKYIGLNNYFSFYVCFLHVCILGEFLSSHTLRENMEMLYSPSPNGPEDIATFLGAVLKRLNCQILPCSPCWFCFYQDYTITSSLTSQTLRHAAIKLLNRIHSWTHVWAWKLSLGRVMPVVWGFPLRILHILTDARIQSSCEGHASPELNYHISKGKARS